MKKLLLSVAVVAASYATSFAQFIIPGPIDFNDVPGLQFSPLFQGGTGTMDVGGQPLPQLVGNLESIGIDAILTASTDFTYANDLTFMVTATPDLTDAAGYLLQVGGFSTFVAGNKHDWPCAPACDTDAPNTPLTGTVSSFAALDFTSTPYVMWLGNGYNGETNVGSWTINSITLGGLGVAKTNEMSNSFVVNAFPNPANEVLNITTNGTEVTSFNVYGLDGKLVATSNTTSVNVAALNAGMYIYEVVAANGAVVKNTFVKK
jgi:hypothetical protein